MNSINFYGYKFEKMTEQLYDYLFLCIDEEIKDYKEEYNKYPEQVHVYECWFEYRDSNHPETDLVIYH